MQSPIALAQLAMTSGLKVATCEDLLRRGWTYLEKQGEPSRWVSPAAKLEEPRKHKRELKP